MVEEIVATGISAMAVFVSFNGGHGTVTHKINVLIKRTSSKANLVVGRTVLLGTIVT